MGLGGITLGYVPRALHRAYVFMLMLIAGGSVWLARLHVPSPARSRRGPEEDNADTLCQGPFARQPSSRDPFDTEQTWQSSEDVMGKQEGGVDDD
ncbi:MAG: hypothetical protein M3Z27_08050 [Actinomycetota bacterium]|nr:hypothetical protein [Actinomycetota bacterium]